MNVSLLGKLLKIVEFFFKSKNRIFHFLILLLFDQPTLSPFE